MADTTYNGWTNYQTWIVNLWFDDGGMSDELQEWAKEELQTAIDNDESDIKPSATYALSKRIAYHVDDLQEICEVKNVGMFVDLLGNALGCVDYYEIAKSYINEITLYSAGFNNPGYLPDSTPSVFIDADEALESVRDSMRTNADDNDDWSESDIDAIDAISADPKGEYGCTIHGVHYFVSVL